jgi:hypothetical protein
MNRVANARAGRIAMRTRIRVKTIRLAVLMSVLTLSWILASGLAAETSPLPATARVDPVYGRLPIHFEPNAGQTDETVQFLARGSGYALFLTKTAALLRLRNAADPARPTLLRLELVGANPAPRVQGVAPLPGRINYYIGGDPARWKTDIPTYARVRYEAIYPGIDLVYYGTQGQLEHDFVVAPGADPAAISLRVDGAERLAIDPEGGLVLTVPGGTVRFHRPVLYQEDGGVRTPVSGSYRLVEPTVVTFTVGPYDPREPLVIDPLLGYSTFLGGAKGDGGSAIAVDATGSAYITGVTESLDFPRFNFYDGFLSGYSDAFVTKLNPTGTALVYSTFLGGGGIERGNGIAADATGAYVTGKTASVNSFPAKWPGVSGYCVLKGGEDAFVTKFDTTGVLVYSRCLGGSGQDSGNAIAVKNEMAYVTGSTSSSDFPTTVGAFDRTHNGKFDAFVAKFDSLGANVIFSTYLGGSTGGLLRGDDEGKGIAVGSGGDNSVYVTGYTSSDDFPTTPGTFQYEYNPPLAGSTEYQDAFVTKLNPSGSALVYSTYLGGRGSDYGYAIAVDAGGAAYVAGSTQSECFPMTAGAFDTTYEPGGPDAFVTKLNPTGTALVYSTYLGGTNSDSAYGIAISSAGMTYVTGVTASSDFPITPNALQLVNKGGGDAFVTQLEANGKMRFSTFLGGSMSDAGSAIAVTADGVGVYVTGSTQSNINFPITPGVFQPTIGGLADAFVTKIRPGDALPIVTVAAVDNTAAEARVKTGTAGIFRITRTGSTSASLFVSFSVAGTATPGSDYALLGRSVTIPAGYASEDLPVTPLNDAVIEAPETVILTLVTNPAYAIGSPGSATVTIASDERPNVTVAATDPTASEANLATGTFTFTRTGDLAAPLTVYYTVSGTATPEVDYASLGASVAFPVGASTATKTVTPVQDHLQELTETVVLALTPQSSYTIVSPGKATVTLTSDEDVTRTATVTATNAIATEEGITPGTFTFTRTGSTAAALTVSYTVSGTAKAGVDYVSLGTSVTFSAGKSTITKTVTPLQDSLQELNETVILTLTQSPNYAVGTPGSATVTIVSDEAITQTVTVAATDAVATEAGLNTGTFTFTRTGSPSVLAAALTVSYTVSGTASPGADYVSLGTGVAFFAGASTTTKIVTPLHDSFQELPETVILTLTQHSSYAVGSPGSATVTLTSDEPISRVVTVTAWDNTATEEGSTPGTFRFSRTGSFTYPLTVYYTVSGTATAEKDYVSLGTNVTIPVGAEFKDVVVTPINDSDVEMAETVIVSLSPSSTYAIGTPSTATVTILSEDKPQVYVQALDNSASENPADTGLFRFARSSDLSVPLTAYYAVSGTASADSDYVLLPGSITFPIGSSYAVVFVTPIDDALVEAPETVIVTITPNPHYTVHPTSNTATVTINSDE